MVKDFNMEAIGYMIDEDSNDRYLISSLKSGDGAIAVDYYDYSIDAPYVGSVNVYSNGAIICLIENLNYADKIYGDYVAISGDKHEPLPDEMGMYRTIVSKDEDPERFKRVKVFLALNNLELKTATEKRMETEMLEKYDDVTIDDIIYGSNRQEEKDYDEGEYHHL